MVIKSNFYGQLRRDTRKIFSSKEITKLDIVEECIRRYDDNMMCIDTGIPINRCKEILDYELPNNEEFKLLKRKFYGI